MPAGNWTYVINNMTTYQYGDTQWSDSDPVVAVATVEVEKGDEIRIMVNTYNPADEWNNPAGELTIKASFEAAAEETVVGDATGDGQVNILDAMRIAQYANEAIGADTLALDACDMNGDGDVNILDAMLVAQMANQG